MALESPVSPALPPAAGQLIGRDRELATLKELVTGRMARHISFVGSPGVGKTRLAVEVARTCSSAFDGGAVLVDLSAVTDPDHVVETVARRLEVPEVPGTERIASVVASLSNRELLLVLDNFEQVAAAASLVPQLLDACPGLLAITTSRAALRVPQKLDVPVTALDLPGPEDLDSPAAVARAGAVRLFVDRAAASRSGFGLSAENCRVVGEICIRLEGLPLAIEMAASRISHLTPWEILERLDQRLGVLRSRTAGIPDRHRSLRASLEWSYGLLGLPGQVLLRRLAVFRGGFDLAAAESVAGFDGVAPADVVELLGDLVEHSLVLSAVHSTSTRYRLLESVREFAGEKLDEAGERELCEARHLDWFAALAEGAEPHLYRSSQVEWVQRIGRDHDNIGAALASAVRPGAGDRSRLAGLRLAGALERYWYAGANVAEGRRWLAQLCADRGVESAPLARVLATSFYLAMVSGEGNVGDLAEHAVRIARTCADPDLLGMALSMLGFARLNDTTPVASLEIRAEALAIVEQLGSHRGGQVWFMCAEVARAAGRESEASEHIQRGLALLEDIGDLYGLVTLESSGGLLALQRGDHQAAERFFGSALEHASEIKIRYGIGILLEFLGWTAAARGDAGRAARLLGGANAALDSIGGRLLPRWTIMHDQYRGMAAGALDAAQFTACWNEGASTPPEALAASALRSGSGGTDRRSQQSLDLTARELDVLRLVVAGHRNREVAAQLVISVRTVERHLGNIYAKIGARGKADAIAYAFRHSLIPR